MNQSLQTISEMIDTYTMHSSMESALAHAEIIAIFDHDMLGRHMLIQQWDRLSDSPGGWEYALYLRHDREGTVTLIQTWPFGWPESTPVPFVEAATLVQQWRDSEDALAREKYEKWKKEHGL